MSLLKEFAGVPYTPKPDLKNSDSTDAGKYDVVDKARKDDVSFSLMRNTINSDGDVTGSDVADYLERAAELNDEVDTVPFGLETDDGDIVKVYVNAEEAEKFEEAMKKLLGLEDDIEAAINELAQEFDIVDVVWPAGKSSTDDSELNQDVDSSFDALDDDEEMEEIARFEPLPESVQMDEYEERDSTPEEVNAYEVLMSSLARLRVMSPAGISVATGLDAEKFTKNEMIAKHLKEKQPKEFKLVLARYKDTVEDEDLPFWLKDA